ncbi:putative acyl-activating enzyme 19 isoform X1 [Malus sylvestris]|uniref:putative acyl-activating enzyme 19 isoform X1 n=1 Tax=Malus domestica TaxID=3750 RepID=UPI0021AC2BDE|nr:putative acyl-activating enzyme 19 isoform X1 [Malus sylvestris]
MPRNDAPQATRSNTHCCLSREFSAAASTNTDKIAVIHASGGALLSLQPRPRFSISDDAAPAPVRQQLLYDGDHSFTYSRLFSAVNSLTSQLLSAPQLPSSYKKLGPRIFGIYMPPSAEYIVSVLSVLRCGEAFLPLDPSWPKQRLLSVISSADVDLIVACKTPFGFESDSNWLPETCKRSVLWFSMEEVGECRNGVIDWACKCESGGKERLWCYLMYTSGSTGKPKGVCGTEGGLLNRFRWMQELYPLFGDEVLLFKTGISFVDHLQEFLSSILTGCTLVIPPFDHLKRNVFSILDFLQAYSVSRLTAVPSLMRTILPSLQGRKEERLPTSLDLLVLSGEVLPLSLWEMLSKILPRTSILNLYGSTEVSGDCTYFDCKRLPMILPLETDTLTSVPIGMPIVNCDIVLVDGDGASSEGEICVAGVCNSSGYYSDSTFTPLDTVNVLQDSACCSSVNGHRNQSYFRTGDFAKQLPSGDLVYLGRKDRTIKYNGQRIALEEIEDTLRGHSDVKDAAVIFHKVQGELMSLVAFVILREERPSEILRSSIKSWMTDILPSVMIPGHIVISESFPVSSSGKIDYELLAESIFLANHVRDGIGDVGSHNLLQVIKGAFSDVLRADEVSDDDDFFMMGGDSIAAAHLSNNIGVDMRLIYSFPTPSKLCTALLERKGSFNMNVSRDSKSKMNLGGDKQSIYHVQSETPNAVNVDGQRRFLRTLSERNEDDTIISKRLKVDSNVASGATGPSDGYPWNSGAIHVSCSFSRCNKVVYEGGSRVKDMYQATCSVLVPRKKFNMQESWKVYVGSCVDASPLIVHKDQDIYLFIGSHSQKFLCVNARSGSVQWEVQLEGRVECSAATLDDFTQVVVGCYRGKIYFLDSLTGNICWTFQTSGEVKSQPVIDSRRQLIWCGSYDHNLYALDYKNHCCVYQLPCGGSIYGSPVIDETNNILYVASTSGRMTAISIMALPFSSMWRHELEAPVFGSLAINSLNGNIICGLVDGQVLALDTSGSVIWRYRTAGPIFAGACISSDLPLQVLVCSRDGSIYSLKLETGDLLWEYNVKDPITSSAYVDEHLSLASDPPNLPDRLVCVCSSSGSVYLLRVNSGAAKVANQRMDVEEFARLDLGGDVFSSPVMIGGRIFVGCRDDYVHCITVKP